MRFKKILENRRIVEDQMNEEETRNCNFGFVSLPDEESVQVEAAEVRGLVHERDFEMSHDVEAMRVVDADANAREHFVQ